MKTTAYFEAMRKRPDRAVIQDAWIERTVQNPMREVVQADGRINFNFNLGAGLPFRRRIIGSCAWSYIADGKTVHNAFFDRGFKP